MVHMETSKEKLQTECKEYKIYAPDSLSYIVTPMQEILLSKILEYKSFFELELDQVQINYFDDKERFRKYITNIRGEDTLPNYATGTYDMGMVNAYIRSDINKQTREYKSKLYMANHELFHILYMRYRQKNNCPTRIIWFDEGMAQLLSGEMDDLLDENMFKEYYCKVKQETKKIPNLNDMTHGDGFCNIWYNGYDLSYLAVRYLSEIVGMEGLKNLLSQTDQLTKYGENIANEIFQYYDAKLSKIRLQR